LYPRKVARHDSRACLSVALETSVIRADHEHDGLRLQIAKPAIYAASRGAACVAVFGGIAGSRG
jgi:hypothetical protein